MEFKFNILFTINSKIVILVYILKYKSIILWYYTYIIIFVYPKQIKTKSTLSYFKSNVKNISSY